MLTELEKFIFPNTCEVVKLDASQEFVFTIFKNGSSSIRRSGTPVPLEAIAGIQQPITVFIRDPRQRFVSGVNTYVQHLLRDNPKLDTATIMYFVKHYLFLNNHYAPQFFWLLNLGRFVGANNKIQLVGFEDLAAYTREHDRAGIERIDPQVSKAIESFDQDKLELYYLLDQTLRERTGRTYRYRELLREIKRDHPELWATVFQPSQELHSVLSEI